MDLREQVNNAVNFLRCRHHPEKPHVSVLSPPHPSDYHLIWGAPKKVLKHDILEEDEEELLEDVEEALRSRYAGWIMGADFEVAGNAGEAQARYDFYVRVEPDYDDRKKWDDSAYTRVQLMLDYYRSPQSAKARATIRLEGEEETFEQQVNVDPAPEFVAVVVLPKRAARRLNRDNLVKVLRMIVSIGVGNYVPGVCLRVVELENELLTASVYSSKGEGLYYHAFCALAGFCGGAFKTYIVNLGGVFEGEGEANAYESPAKVYTYNTADGTFSRWVLGHLLEVQGKVKFSGWRPRVRWSEHGLMGAHPVNALVIERDPGEYELRDYCVEEEGLAPIKVSGQSVDDFLRHVVFSIQRFGGRLPDLVNALSEAIKKANPQLRSFYTYQEEAINEILSNLAVERKYKAITVVARTAGGKTLAFLVPIIISILHEKLGGRGLGLKAILTYPTKALANDQLEEAAHLLFYFKQSLDNKGLSADVSFGCLHGGTYTADDVEKKGSFQLVSLPVKCPNHQGSVVKLQTQDGKVKAVCPADSSCQFAEFLNSSMRKTRDEIYFNPPDILITDEDMLNRILSGYSRKHQGERGEALWYEWQLLGYPYKRCTNCSHTYPISLNLMRCAVCGSDVRTSLETIESVSRPYVIVLDEAHQLFGSFGIQVSHMLSLLEHVIGDEPLYVLSSATLGNAEHFAATMLGLSTSEVKKVAAEAAEANSAVRPFQRIIAFIMPKAYTQDATLIKLLGAFLEAFQDKPKGIIFTNTLAESNELLQQLRRDFGSRVHVDGHSTDYGEDRADKELRFKEGKIDWFVATSTLELGVDYGVVDYVAIYGMPHKVTSFVQRIGRAGRGKDAVVFVLFNPDNPVNHFYYENHRMLCDGMLREAAIEREVITVSRMNKEAVRRAIRRWAVSEVYRACSPMCAADPKLISVGLENTQVRRSRWQVIAQLLKARVPDDLPKSLKELCSQYWNTYGQLVNGEVSWIAQELGARGANWKDISGFVVFLGQDPLYDLRGADETVQVYFAPLGETRSRELRFAVRHYLKGQIASFRGRFFVVATVEPEEKVGIREWLEGGEGAGFV